MEGVWFQVEFGHLLGRYFDSGGIGSLCQFCLDLEPRRSPGIGNQIDDGLVADQRSCPPVALTFKLAGKEHLDCGSPDNPKTGNRVAPVDGLASCGRALCCCG